MIHSELKKCVERLYVNAMVCTRKGMSKAISRLPHQVMASKSKGEGKVPLPDWKQQAF
jgi:hypothetical protein